MRSRGDRCSSSAGLRRHCGLRRWAPPGKRALAAAIPASLALTGALTASIVLATVLAGATWAVPALPVSSSLAALLDACQQAILEQYATPGGAVVASLGLLLMVTVAGRLGLVLTAEYVATSKCRRRQRRSPHVGGRPSSRDGSTRRAACLAGGLLPARSSWESSFSPALQ